MQKSIKTRDPYIYDMCRYEQDPRKEIVVQSWNGKDADPYSVGDPDPETVIQHPQQGLRILIMTYLNYKLH
jgi:hypothetical protein